MEGGIQLAAGERLLWSGKPRQGLCLRQADFFAIPFSLLWCGFAIFWETSVMAESAPLMFQLWGVPFVLAGLYIVAGRFFADAAMRGRTDYAVTSERILITAGWWARQTISLQLRTLTEITLVEEKSGVGTITFGPQNPARRYLPGGWPGAGQLGPMFDMIDGAKSVNEIIRRAQQAARQ